MKNKPIIVELIKAYGNQYEIKFPNLKRPLTVDRYYYEKMMRNPDEFKFI